MVRPIIIAIFGIGLAVVVGFVREVEPRLLATTLPCAAV